MRPCWNLFIDSAGGSQTDFRLLSLSSRRGELKKGE